MSRTLTTYDHVPNWEKIYIYSRGEIEDADALQQKFYEEYKAAFRKGIYYDLCGNTNYCFVLLFDLRDNYEHTHKELDRLRGELQILSEVYPETLPYVTDLLIKAFVAQKRHTEAWSIKRLSGIYGIEDIVQFERALKKSLMDADTIRNVAGIKGLTLFGRKHVAEIMVMAERQVRKFENEKGRRLTLHFIKNTKWDEYDLAEYEKYFTDKKAYTLYFKINNSAESKKEQSVANQL